MDRQMENMDFTLHIVGGTWDTYWMDSMPMHPIISIGGVDGFGWTTHTLVNEKVIFKFFF